MHMQVKRGRYIFKIVELQQFEPQNEIKYWRTVIFTD